MVKISEKEGAKKKLIYILLDIKKPVTIAYLASLINKTGRTVQNYLDELELELREYGITLFRKTNIGVYIEGNLESLAKCKAYLYNDNVIVNFQEKYSSNYRRQYIIKILLEEKTPYTIQFFSDNLYCSKSAIVNDLSYVQTWLEKRNLMLKRKQNQGLWAEGNEEDFRNALRDFFYEGKEKEFEDNNLFDDIDEIDYRIDFVNYKKLKNMFNKLDIHGIQLVIQQAEEKIGFCFTDQAFLNLITHIAITIERVRNDKSIEMKQEFMETLLNTKEYTIAKWMIEQLSKTFKVQFSKEEIGYISVHLLGAKIQEDVEDNNYAEILDNSNEESMDIAKEIISTCSEILNMDFTKDQNLLVSLVLHLKPTIVRLKYGLKLYNPLLERIKNEYTSIFGATWACSSIFERKLGLSINEDEVSYITLHLALAADRLKRKIKAIICCSSGIGTSQMVALNIKNRFEELEIMKVIPYSYLKQQDIEEADLIITTIKNVKYIPKLIYISSLLDSNDLKNIEKAIKNAGVINTSNNKTQQKELDAANQDIFDEELIFLHDISRDFIEAITYYGTMLEKKHYAKDGFYNDVLKREKVGTTYLGRGIAIPHAMDKFVDVSKVCIVRFNNPIIWNGNKIELLIILCLKFDDAKVTKEFFKKLYGIMADDEIINKIKIENDPKEIIRLLNQGGNDNGRINN